MASWQKLGAHRFHVEGDVVFIELHGDFGRDDAQVLWDTVIQVEQKHRHVLRVYDARDGMSMTPEARQYISDCRKKYSPNGPDVIVGANITLRTIVNLLQHAARIIKRPTSQVHFCATLDEVPEVLEMHRKLLRAKYTAKIR